MTRIKGIAMMATVLVVGKITLTFLPGNIYGKDTASFIWALLLIGCHFLAVYAVRWARTFSAADAFYIAVGGVTIAFITGFILHQFTNPSDVVLALVGSLCAVYLSNIFIIALWVRLTEVIFSYWTIESGKNIPLVWNQETGAFVARKETGDVLLTHASEFGEAFSKSLVFQFYPMPDSTLKTRIDNAFAHILFPQATEKYLLEKPFLLGFSITTGFMMLALWDSVGAMSIVLSFLLYLLIVFNLNRYLLKVFNRGSQLGRNPDTAQLAIKAYERSFIFFSTRRWLRFLTPFSLVYPTFQAQKDLSSIGSTYLVTMKQKDKAIQAYQRLITLYPEHIPANWLLKVIQHIESNQSAT